MNHKISPPVHVFLPPEAGSRFQKPVSPPASHEQRKKIDQLNKLVDDAPKYVGAAYRGMNFDTREEASKIFNALFETPSALNGFSSFSPSMETGYYYANLPRGGRFKLIMIIPDSKNGTYLGANSLQPRDKELLFDQKTYFQGLTFTESGDTVYVLCKEVHDDFGQDKFPMYIPGSHHENLTPEQQEERRKICEKARKFIKNAWKNVK